eukprot:COSAG01_NODE_53562_length_338_cov_0.866109_1_plen_56_part_10
MSVMSVSQLGLPAQLLSSSSSAVQPTAGATRVAESFVPIEHSCFLERSQHQEATPS